MAEAEAVGLKELSPGGLNFSSQSFALSVRRLKRSTLWVSPAPLRGLKEKPMPYWRLFYHMVWGVKNREPLIQVEFEEPLHNVMAAKAKELGAFVYAVGGIDDHVHLVVSVPPKIALADFIGQVIR
jgi:hypothetical protein